jgi:hypothetical protein
MDGERWSKAKLASLGLALCTSPCVQEVLERGGICLMGVPVWS